MKPPDPLKHDKTRGPERLVHCPHHLLSLTQKNMQRHQTSVRNLFPEQSCEVIYCHIMLFLGRYCLTAAAGLTKLEILFQFLLFCTEKAALPGRRWQLFHLKTGLTFTFFQLRLTCRTCLHMCQEFRLGEEEYLDLRSSSDFELGRPAPPSLRRRASTL